MVVAPEQFHTVVADGFGRQRHRANEFAVAFLTAAKIFHGVTLPVKNIGECSIAAGSVLQAQVIDAGIGQHGTGLKAHLHPIHPAGIQHQHGPAKPGTGIAWVAFGVGRVDKGKAIIAQAHNSGA